VARELSVQIIKLIFECFCIPGPKGSNFAYASDDDKKVRKLEKKVFKLESEVTVLETAMADLAKRLLVLEQKPGSKNSFKFRKLT